MTLLRISHPDGGQAANAARIAYFALHPEQPGDA